MAIYLFDTNAISDLMHRHPAVEPRFRTCVDPVITSNVVRGEIRYGIELMPPGRRRAGLEARSLLVFAVVPCRPITARMADRYAELRALVERSGFTLTSNDLWIAAAALVLGAVLVTRDSDFGRIPGLTVEDWSV